MGRPMHRASLSGRIPDSFNPKEEPKSVREEESQHKWKMFYRAIRHFREDCAVHRSSCGYNDKEALVTGSFRDSFFLCFSSIMNLGLSSSSPLPISSRIRSSLILPFLKCILLCAISILVLVMVLGGGSSSAGKQQQYYRRLQEGALQMFSSISNNNVVSLKQIKSCSSSGMEDYVPCYDMTANSKAGFSGGAEFDRHCHLSKIKLCVLRTPKDYRLPLKWPACRDNVWNSNVRIDANYLQNKRILLEDDVLSFEEENEHVKNYIGKIEAIIGSANKSLNEMGIRTVLDIGNGIGTLAAHLIPKNLFTMSISAYQMHGGAVQMALERGLPAVISSFFTRQLPFSIFSYDMIHCADCGIQWHLKDGIFLMEADRLLRPGGYFIWTNTNHSLTLVKQIDDVAFRICWTQYSQFDRTVIWQKTTKQQCYSSRAKMSKEKRSVVCGDDLDGGDSLRACVIRSSKIRWRTVQQQHVWPNRLMLSSRRLVRYGFARGEFNEDMHSWGAKVNNYWSLFSPVIFSDHPKRPGDEDPTAPANVVRNIMDMNAEYGSFNAALLSMGKPVWVMNVVPLTSNNNTLPLIFDRGLLGLNHDWCQPFPGYPRTYDLMYATSLLSQQLNHPNNSCGNGNLLLEIDRLLRPEGWLILEDEMQVVEDARSSLMHIRWEARIIEVRGGDDSNLRLMLAQKPWRK